MKIIKNIFRDFYLYMLWAILAWVIVGFTFVRVTDTSVDKKVVFFINAKIDSTALSAKLEEKMPEGIKMIRAREFSYAMFDSEAINNADFYIVYDEELEAYKGVYADISKLAAEKNIPEEDLYKGEDGCVYGIRIHEKFKEGGVASEYIVYSDKSYYLTFNKDSVHSLAITGNGDNAAVEVFEELMKLK